MYSQQRTNTANQSNAMSHNNSYHPEQVPQNRGGYNQQQSNVHPARANNSVGNQGQYQQNNRDARPSSEINPDLAPSGKFYSIKIHGSKAAVEFKADVTRKGVHTIRIEAAKGANEQ